MKYIKKFKIEESINNLNLDGVNYIGDDSGVYYFQSVHNAKYIKWDTYKYIRKMTNDKISGSSRYLRQEKRDKLEDVYIDDRNEVLTQISYSVRTNNNVGSINLTVISVGDDYYYAMIMTSSITNFELNLTNYYYYYIYKCDGVDALINFINYTYNSFYQEIKVNNEAGNAFSIIKNMNEQL